MRIRDVAVIAPELISPFELSVACEVFGLDRSDQGLPVYDFAVCAQRRGPIPTTAGFSITTSYGLDRTESADLVIVPTWPDPELRPKPRVVAALRSALGRGARVASFCTGAYALAYAGLLDGRRVTTHHRFARDLAARFPRIEVDPAVLYVIDGPVLTSAGTAAAIDLCLYLVRDSDGPEVATEVARRMVVPPQRSGGQAQFIDRPVPRSTGEEQLAALMDWMVEHLHEELTVEELARRLHVAPRTFARRFRDETGTTPHHWLTAQRVLHAQHLLATSAHDVDRVAELCGFGSAATLRHHFARRVGTSPQQYRRAFGLELAAAAGDAAAAAG